MTESDIIMSRTLRSMSNYLDKAGEESPQEALRWIRRVKEEMEHLEEIAVLRAISAGCSKSECAALLHITRQTLDNRHKQRIADLITKQAAEPETKLYIEEVFVDGHIQAHITDQAPIASNNYKNIYIMRTATDKTKEHQTLLLEWNEFKKEEERTGHKATKAAFARQQNMSRPTVVRKLRKAEENQNRTAEANCDTPDTPKYQMIWKLNPKQDNSQQK